MTQSLMERKPFHLVLLVIVILQSIRTKKERKTTLIDTVKMKTGKTIEQLVSTKHILWNKPTIEASVKDTNKKFPNLNIKLK